MTDSDIRKHLYRHSSCHFPAEGRKDYFPTALETKLEAQLIITEYTYPGVCKHSLFCCTIDGSLFDVALLVYMIRPVVMLTKPRVQMNFDVLPIFLLCHVFTLVQAIFIILLMNLLVICILNHVHFKSLDCIQKTAF